MREPTLSENDYHAIIQAFINIHTLNDVRSRFITNEQGTGVYVYHAPYLDPKTKRVVMQTFLGRENFRLLEEPKESEKSEFAYPT